MAKVNYSRKELEDKLKQYLEQRGVLLQSIERIEGAIIAFRNLLDPPQVEARSAPVEDKDTEQPDSNEEKGDEAVEEKEK